MKLELTNVSSGYGKVTVLVNVSLSVYPREWVAVVGGNGAGKTTLFKTISGLLRPSHGSIKVDGAELTVVPPHEIVELGVIQVPEGRMVFPKMTVKENLLLGGRSKRARKYIWTNIRKVFSIFPVLEKRASQEAGTLSGGEQQMLAIGRGLMAVPNVLLLDEPSLGLAPLVIKEIFGVLKRINEDGVTMLMVEQNVRLSLKVSDRAYVMENGKIVKDGVSPGLMSDPEIKRAYLGM
ncbi:MAG: ABC transporter ATP-binding protein [Candidatus Methanomethylicaceae archaeon]